MFKSVLIAITAIAFMFASVISCTAQEYKMQKLIDQATAIVNEFKEMPEDDIPSSVLDNCKGLAIISVLKGGFIIGARGGSGIVVAKNAQGIWSAPSAIAMGGASIGFQIGAEQIDFILVLNTDSAVNALSQNNVTLGGDVSVAAGPVGRTAEGSVTAVSAIYAYSRSKGLFAGVSLEGAIVTEQNDVNEAFYGKAVTATEILNGTVQQPEQANHLYNALSQHDVVEAKAAE